MRRRGSRQDITLGGLSVIRVILIIIWSLSLAACAIPTIEDIGMRFEASFCVGLKTPGEGAPVELTLESCAKAEAAGIDLGELCSEITLP